MNLQAQHMICKSGSWGKQSTSPAETTEKFGLEAGLWQVFRTKDANGVSRTDQAKQLLKTYGSAYLITSISFAIVSFAACYALVTAGRLPNTLSQFVLPCRNLDVCQQSYFATGNVRLHRQCGFIATLS